MTRSDLILEVEKVCDECSYEPAIALIRKMHAAIERFYDVAFEAQTKPGLGILGTAFIDLITGSPENPPLIAVGMKGEKKA